MTQLKANNDVSKFLNEVEWQILQALAAMQHLKKNEQIVAAGQHCDQEVFIEKGIVRAYLIDDEGNDKSTAFFQAGAFMSTSTLRTQNGRSLYNYQALCDTTVWIFNSTALKTTLSSSKKLMAIGKSIKEKELARLNNRDRCLMQVKASDKYLKFIHFYPDLESLIAQRHIASYLGITPVSLSRLKKELIRPKTHIN
jgi:CRP-like cAMP-binding protein